MNLRKPFWWEVPGPQGSKAGIFLADNAPGCAGKDQELCKLPKFCKFLQQPPEKLTSMASPWSFGQWRIDLIGPLPKGRGAATHAIIAIDYFTKWIEVEAFSRITEKKTTDFVWRNMVCRYGIPYILVTDNGRQFNNYSFRDFCQNLGI